jgi:hypothetical protein
MKPNDKPTFDPKIFLGVGKIGEGRTTAAYEKNQLVFGQGDPANAIFYVQKGKVKLTVVSPNGKEAVVAILAEGNFFGAKDVWRTRRCAWRPRPPWTIAGS